MPIMILKWCPKSGAVMVPQQHEVADACVELSCCRVKQVAAFQGNTNPALPGLQPEQHRKQGRKELARSPSPFSTFSIERPNPCSYFNPPWKSCRRDDRVLASSQAVSSSMSLFSWLKSFPSCLKLLYCMLRSLLLDLLTVDREIRLLLSCLPPPLMWHNWRDKRSLSVSTLPDGSAAPWLNSCTPHFSAAHAALSQNCSHQIFHILLEGDCLKLGKILQLRSSVCQQQKEGFARYLPHSYPPPTPQYVACLQQYNIIGSHSVFVSL